MTFAARGAGTSVVEVTNISQHGFWLLIDDQEVFLPFETFPWFKDAPVGKILHVELPSAHHLYWPDLDIDLEIESVYHPERYPLASTVHEAREGYAASEQVVDGDRDLIDDCVLALLQLTLHQGARAWKGFDYEVMDRLFKKGFLLDPRNRAKSIVLTEEGLARSERLFGELFGKK
ncbi:DUF6429 family protein [Geomobilimonas luticola]|uniref:DUF2442 domain-containing protein n=1 Tax=Geomobilimonas luticola TaxID=1114878 RepID=A0ABS5SAR0_9BACT|nr:DUF6429 family protein [Geomobilimonas luticola]MBT0652448.1 DUF2442 domain-containing protein [Geomobilimonas luticola]